jgi:ArsR family transcriptional regulator, arsenate/arsenite/antimonite-responsive transcriptional repressor
MLNKLLLHRTNKFTSELAATKTRGERELEELDRVFKALAHESRRTILTVLKSRGGTMTAGDIVKRFSYAWPTITRHLQQLEDAGLITSDKKSREQHYSVNDKYLTSIVGKWLNWLNDSQ